MSQGKISSLETVQITEHLRFRPVAIEHRVDQIGRASFQTRGNPNWPRVIFSFRRIALGENLQKSFHILGRGGLVQRDSDRLFIDRSQVVTGSSSFLQ